MKGDERKEQESRKTSERKRGGKDQKRTNYREDKYTRNEGLGGAQKRQRKGEKRKEQERIERKGKKGRYTTGERGTEEKEKVEKQKSDKEKGDESKEQAGMVRKKEGKEEMTEEIYKRERKGKGRNDR